jgi:putative serine protease PepD
MGGRAGGPVMGTEAGVPFVRPGGPPPGFPPAPDHRPGGQGSSGPAGPDRPGGPSGPGGVSGPGRGAQSGAPAAGTGPGRPRRNALLAAILAAGLLGGVTGALVDRAVIGQRTVISSLAAPPLPAANTVAAPGSVQQVAAAVLPSVVSIEVQAGRTADEGSGVILTSDGLILTNNHVVEAAATTGTITVGFHDGTTADATIVGRDPTSDLAVLRAKGVTTLRPATFGQSADLQVGQPVVAIGSPLGLSGTVTSGIVSALNRPVRTGDTQTQDNGQDTVIDAVQTDAAINPGNSGGPLVNMRGEVVGINSAIASLGQGQEQGGQGGSIGLGFAIPSDEAQPIAQQLAQSGRANHAQLGVSVQDTAAGATLLQVQANGPAARAGLAADDVITKVADRRIDSADALVAAVRSHRPAEKVLVAYTRDKQSRTTTVTLGSEVSAGN